MPDFSIEDEVSAPVCGVDEAGRGPWAGPLAAAAVILDRSAAPEGIDDSKKLSPARRDALFERIMASAEVGVGLVEVAELDRIGLGEANDLAMLRAIAALPRRPAFALFDGRRIPPGAPCDAAAVIRGDGRSLSIAAASIIAKVTRDRIMDEIAGTHPVYGWSTNRGYGTRAHVEALRLHGVTPHHRRSFRPIHKMLCEEN